MSCVVTYLIVFFLCFIALGSKDADGLFAIIINAIFAFILGLIAAREQHKFNKNHG